jgi:hypothetical protein
MVIPAAVEDAALWDFTNKPSLVLVLLLQAQEVHYHNQTKVRTRNMATVRRLAISDTIWLVLQRDVP